MKKVIEIEIGERLDKLIRDIGEALRASEYVSGCPFDEILKTIRIYRGEGDNKKKIGEERMNSDKKIKPVRSRTNYTSFEIEFLEKMEVLQDTLDKIIEQIPLYNKIVRCPKCNSDQISVDKKFHYGIAEPFVSCKCSDCNHEWRERG